MVSSDLSCFQGRFSMLTTLKLALQMLKGIESIHEYGYLHRYPLSLSLSLIPSLSLSPFNFLFVLFSLVLSRESSLLLLSLLNSSRDIKPSNFAMGLTASKKQTCFFIDFGLSRRFMLPDGELRPPREVAGFRGTARCVCLRVRERESSSRLRFSLSLFLLRSDIFCSFTLSLSLSLSLPPS